MNKEKETSKEIKIFFLIIILIMISPIIIFKCIWLYEEYDEYQYYCKDTFNNCYYVEHINKGFKSPTIIELNGKIITIVQYKKINKYIKR